MAGVWVSVDQGGRALDPAALGLLTEARRLTADVAAVALGPGSARGRGRPAAHGARTVFASDDRSSRSSPASRSYVLGELARAHAPELVLFGPSYDSRDVASRLQAILGVSLVAGVDGLLAADRVRVSVALSLWPGRPGNLRGGVGGTKQVEVVLAAAPTLVIARGGAFVAVPCDGDGADVVEVDVPVAGRRRGAAARAARRGR
jgi:electron transfer flavoprotein alpha subunit